MEQIIKVISELPPTIKIFIGVMLGIQTLAFSAWIVMMMREGSNDKKEKQS